MKKFSAPYKRIVLTGPESTGKTTLAKALAKKFNTIWIPEFAREYAYKVNNQFTYENVLEIARTQLVQEMEFEEEINKLVFFDTSLIITKVWLDVVFGKHPTWLDQMIKVEEADLYLLCAPDIDWIPDKVRINNGEKRQKLFETYLNELEKLKFNYKIVSGKGKKRLNTCINYVNELLPKKILLQKEF